MRGTEGMAGPSNSLPESVGGTPETAATLISAAQNEKITDEYLEYLIRKFLRLSPTYWCRDIGAAMSLAPDEAQLQYVVWDGTYWNACFRTETNLYRGQSVSVTRAIIAAALKARLNAPDITWSPRDGEDDESTRESGDGTGEGYVS